MNDELNKKPRPINKDLYNYVKKLADEKFKSKTGIYKSSWIVKEYKKRGGKYKGKVSQKQGLLRWYKEKWVDLNRPIKNKKGKIIGYKSCGRSKVKNSKEKYPLCRPTYKISKSTPRTYSQISKKSILKAKKLKARVKGIKNIKFGSGKLKSTLIKLLEKEEPQNQNELNKYKDLVKTYKKELENEKDKMKILYINNIIVMLMKVIKKYEKRKKIGSGRHKKEYICKFCNEKFIGTEELRKHKREHEKNINCKLCVMEKLDQQHMKNLKKYFAETEDKNKEGGGKSQYYGKRSSIMVKVPKDVKKWAEYAFTLKKLGFEGAIETGWKRAHQLSTKEKIPIEDLRYMRNWYARHIYTSYPTFRKWVKAGRPKTKEWHNKRGIQAWITWGANAGFKWVNSDKVINILNKHFDKNYKKIKVKVINI